jgi:hypothetical protein
VLDQSEWSADDLVQIRQWWVDSVDNDILAVAWSRRHDWETLHQRRDRLFKIQQIASRIIQTDLYMTGPPYPGPR